MSVRAPGRVRTSRFPRLSNVRVVARFSAYDEDLEKDAYAARYASAALPIPPILERGPVGGGFYAIAPRMPGGHIDNLDAEGMRRVLPSFFAALDAMRAVDAFAGPGYGGWRADGRTRHTTWRSDLLG